jgi:3-dehydroquinate synthase
LPPREIAAGLAEIIKYGLLGDAEFLEWLEQNIEKLVALDCEALVFAIKRSCENKAKIVSADEREGGVRALLNLGHTFGHAIETELGYGNWLHGEAVGAGMMIASELSRALGWLSDEDVLRVRSLLERAGLPISAPKDMTVDQFIEHMSVDKKVLDGNLRFVLLKSLGQAVVTDAVPHALLQDVLQTSISAGLAQSK